MRRALALALAVPFLATLAAPADAAPRGPMCQGKRATIVGDGTKRIIFGTPGDDVIVTRGSTYVVPGRGDDLVCVTRSEGRISGVRVADIGGDDRVVVVPRTAEVRATVRLGPGDDYYRGGAGYDVVAGQGGRDTILTGAGSDAVYTGGPGGVGDRVDLGPGGDYVEVRGRRNAGGLVDGGPGRDRIAVTPELGDEVRVDVPAGVVRADGAPALRFTELESWWLAPVVGGRLSFVGSATSEHVDAIGWPAFVADMGDGDDRLEVGLGDAAPGSIDVVGGSGRNWLSVLGTQTTVDMSAGRGELVTGVAAVLFEGFGDVDAYGEDVVLTGTDGPNALTAAGCRVTVDGGDGDDRIEVLQRSYGTLDCSGGLSSTVHGEGGDDRMFGRGITEELDDTLDGGDGTDYADGRGGVDTCIAETRVRCEQ